MEIIVTPCKAEPATDGGGEIRVRLFGLVELENQWGCGAEKPSGSSQPWMMLKYLLANPYREASQEELTENLWPDKAEIKADRVYRVCLLRLRKALAPLGLDGKKGLVLPYFYTPPEP